MAEHSRNYYSEWFAECIWLQDSEWEPVGQCLAAMLYDGHISISDRKWQLFVVACARRVVDHLPEICRKTIDIAEVAADVPEGLLSVCPLETYVELAEYFEPYGPPPDYLPKAELSEMDRNCFQLGCELARPDEVWQRIRRGGSEASNIAWIMAGRPLESPEIRPQIHLLRDILGNPFRPVTVEPSWLTSDVVGLAAGIYADRAFDRLPILADALQEAGCEHPDVLDHCRGPGPHVRGCWVVDLLLGKK